MAEQNISEKIIASIMKDTVTASLTLAAVEDLTARNFWLDNAKRYGYAAMVDTFTGDSKAIKNGFTIQLIDKSIDNKVIINKDTEIHAVVHACMAALGGLNTPPESLSHMQVNYSVVRGDNWVTVSIIGYTSFNAGTTHKNCGVGTMHIENMPKFLKYSIEKI